MPTVGRGRSIGSIVAAVATCAVAILNAMASPLIHLKIACGVLNPHVACTSATLSPLALSKALIFAPVAAMLIVGADETAEETDDVNAHLFCPPKVNVLCHGETLYFVIHKKRRNMVTSFKQCSRENQSDKPIYWQSDKIGERWTIFIRSV